MNSNVPDWRDLLPTRATLAGLAPDAIDRTDRAIEQYSITLGFGIAAVGHLLACAAASDDTGLAASTATDIGWLLQALGELTARLADTGNALNDCRALPAPRA